MDAFTMNQNEAPPGGGASTACRQEGLASSFGDLLSAAGISEPTTSTNNRTEATDTNTNNTSSSPVNNNMLLSNSSTMNTPDMELTVEDFWRPTNTTTTPAPAQPSTSATTSSMPSTSFNEELFNTWNFGDESPTSELMTINPLDISNRDFDKIWQKDVFSTNSGQDSQTSSLGLFGFDIADLDVDPNLVNDIGKEEVKEEEETEALPDAPGVDSTNLNLFNNMGTTTTMVLPVVETVPVGENYTVISNINLDITPEVKEEDVGLAIQPVLQVPAVSNNDINNRMELMSVEEAASDRTVSGGPIRPRRQSRVPTVQLAAAGMPVRRGRGRPPVTDRKITAKVNSRGQILSDDGETSASEGFVPETEIDFMKYRRMRDLNNEASKRCREKRKEKQAKELEELGEQQRRNEELKRILATMTNEVTEQKEKVMSLLGNRPSMPHAKFLWSQMGFTAQEFLHM